MEQMHLNYFTNDETFPFFAQYGFHTENMFLHSHKNFFELVIVLKGSATHLVNHDAFFISKGDVFIIGSDTYHGYQDPKDFRICNIMFHPDFFFAEHNDLQETSGFQSLFVIEPLLSQKGCFESRLKLNPYHYEHVHRIIDDIIEEYEKAGVGYKTLVTGLFYILAATLSRLYLETNPPLSHDIIGMTRSITYMENHYMEDLTINELAEIAGFSPRHFSRRFYEIKRTTPIHYLQIMRLEKSIYYLKNTTLSILDIATECGFSDSNYFSRLFKKHYGMTPT